METVKRSDGWWVTGIPETDDAGPYDTKASAEEDRIGMERFLRHQDKRGYVTSCKRADN